MNKPVNYYDGLNLKLFDAIPKAANRILELGCANGRLGRLYKESHPRSQWLGVDSSGDAIAAASQSLDRVFTIDLNRDDLGILAAMEKFDVVVIGDLLEHLIHPDKLLDQLYRLTTPDAKIICCLPNMAHISVVQRLLCGDMSYDDMGLLDKTHLRLYSPSAAFKVFLDSGWLPHLRDQYRAEPGHSEFLERITQAAGALGIPAATAKRNLGMYQMILECIKWQPPMERVPHPDAGLSVIVPVNREWECELNIARSPGLREIQAEILYIKDAGSAADAYAIGRRQSKNSWCVMAHQDVYFPAGTGRALLSELDQLEQSSLTACPVGFAGLAVSPDSKVCYAGMVIDRATLFNHPGSRSAISIDEFAVALHRDSRVDIDPDLGWHAWATDLCLQALVDAGEPNAVILELPFFHNSLNAYALPESFHASAAVLLAKYPDMEKIHTLCGTLSR